MQHGRILICLALIAFASAGVKASEPAVPAKRSFTSCDLKVSFEYPYSWGEPVITDYRGRTMRSYLLGPAGLDWKLAFNGPVPRDFNVKLRIGEFTSDDDLRILAYEGSCDSTSIGALRTRVKQNASRRICGSPALVEEEHFDPAGTAVQKITWLHGSRVYEIYFEAKIRDFENVRYDWSLGFSPLCELNPNDSRLTTFKAAVEEWIGSIRCE